LMIELGRALSMKSRWPVFAGGCFLRIDAFMSMMCF
jgi:hypothetical protein